MDLTLNEKGVPLLQGAPLDLPPKAEKLLILLIQQAPYMATKNDIIDVVWGGQSVTDAAIARCISDIRKKVNAITIEPVYRRGYRLVLDPPDVHRRLLQVANAHPEIVNNYLHARAIAQLRTPSSIFRAIDLLRALISKYPHYAPAQVLLASTMISALSLNIGLNEQDVKEEVARLLQSAEHAGGHLVGLETCHALILDLEWNFGLAEAVHQQALAAGPNDAESYLNYGWHCLATGHFGEASKIANHLIHLDSNVAAHHDLWVRSLMFNREIDLAEFAILQATKNFPDDTLLLGLYLVMMATIRPDEEIVIRARKLSERQDIMPHLATVLPNVLVRMGRRDEASQLVMAYINQEHNVPSKTLFFIPTLLQLGQVEQVNSIISKAYLARCALLPIVLQTALAQKCNYYGNARAVLQIIMNKEH